MSPATTPPDLLPLEDVATRLRLSPRSVKRLAKIGLPLFHVAGRYGPLYAAWPEVQAWFLANRHTVSTGQIRTTATKPPTKPRR